MRCPVCCSETGTNSGASVGRPDSLRSAQDSPYARSNSLLRGTASGNFPKQARTLHSGLCSALGTACRDSRPRLAHDHAGAPEASRFQCGVAAGVVRNVDMA